MRSELQKETARIILEERGGGDPQNVQLARCDWDHSLDGKRLGDVTKGRGLEPTIENAAETALWIVEKGGCQGIFHAIGEEDLQRILRHPATMIGSDGEVPIFGDASPHPRSYGTFVRVLGRYVRELKVITLEDAVRKMSAFPAQRIGLADRGVLREGMKADIAIFDPATVRDAATFERPHQYAEGVMCVIVNGQVAFENGRMTAARPGPDPAGPAVGPRAPGVRHLTTVTTDDDKVHLFPVTRPILLVGKRMKKLAVAAVATALARGGSLRPAGRNRARADASTAPKLATAHPRRGGDRPRRRDSSTQTRAEACRRRDVAISIDAQNKLVAQNCASCHSEKMKAGELVLAGFDAAKIAERPDVAEKMIRKLRAGMMPPPGARRPDAATTKAFVDALEAKMDAAAALNPNPGWRPFQRLNRAEYQHAVKDLLGIDVDVNAFLPPDTISHGFDNVADVQAFSPTLMESYLRAASSDQPPRGRRPQRQRRRRPPTRSAAPARRCATSTARRWARAAASRSCTPSRPTATTSSRCRCTTSRSAASTAAPRWRRWTSRSRSRCRSTASAPRCSTSTCG